MLRPFLAALLALPLAACSSSADSPQGSGPADSGTTDGGADADGPLDPSVNDPVPADLPELVAHAASGNDVAPVLSCAGSPLPIQRGAAQDREFHLIELGGQDADRVGELPVELFLNNQLGTPDLSMTSSKSDDATKTGIFQAKTHAGYIGYRIAAAPGYLGIVGLDLDVPEEGPVLPTVPTESKVTLLSILIAGSMYEPTPGAGRAVVRIVDCDANPIAGAHVSLEVDGAVVKPSKSEGVRRNYFGDSELPSEQKLTSRAGVVVFLDVPPGAKNVRVVARGKSGGETKVIAMRNIPLVADGVTTAKVSPYQTP